MKKQLRITVNGQTFEVLAELIDDGAPTVAPLVPSAAPVAASAAAAAPAATVEKKAAPASSGDGEVLSPLAGKVVSLDKPVGSSVKTGEVVMTLEAMKMNTTVSAPADGKVAKILVNPGDSVEEGQPLLVIE